MSSLEIAELTGKRHTHVLRDIRSMLELLGLTETRFGSSYTDPTGRTLLCFNLPKDLTFTLVAGYSAPLRHKIVTRWIELERKEFEGRLMLPNFGLDNLRQVIHAHAFKCYYIFSIEAS